MVTVQRSLCRSHFVILDRQGVSRVDTPEVSVCVCVHMWKCVFSSVFAHECVSKGKMWFELRPANRCLLAAQCFDSRVGLYTQCLLCRSGAFFSSPF